MIRFSLIALIVFSSSNLVSAKDWIGFRGPNGSGSSSETNLPVEWSADSNVAWKLKLPGAGASSPTILARIAHRVLCQCGCDGLCSAPSVVATQLEW